MRAKVYEDMCIGCGLCVTLCPEVFVMEDEKAKVIADTSVATYDEVQDAITCCPAAAIGEEE